MIDISDELKNIYKNDRLPSHSGEYIKDLELEFPELGITIDYDRIVSESFELTERLCSQDDLTFGACESAQVIITVADVIQDLVGKTCIITQTINNTYTMPFGTYTVTKAELQSDKRFKKLTMFDHMQLFNTNVASWYNALTFPITLKSFRISLLNYIGVEFETQDLPNDNLQIYKTVNTDNLNGRDVLVRICELHGGFGHFTRYDKLKVIGLSGLGLYPSETLYPSEDLFPSESGEYLVGDGLSAGYKKATFEEYIVSPITKLQINQEEGDIGAIVGDGDNAYIITGNFLVYGKNSTELTDIANVIFLVIKNKYYMQHKTELVGLPYVEVGDAITCIMSTNALESFVFIRTLKGIQVLSDTYEAKGKPKRDNKVTVNTQIQQLMGKSSVLKRSVDQLSIDMTDMEEGLQSQITQTAGQLQTEITDNYNQLNSTITQTAGSLQTQITDNKSDANSQISQLSSQISFKVSRGDLSSELSLEPGQVVFNSNRLVINSTNLNLDANGNATFSGDIVGATITGSYGASFTSVNVRGTSSDTNIYGGFVECSSLSVNSINGGAPITSNNPASELSDSGYQLNWSGSQCLFAWSGQNLGQSSYRWGTVYLSSAPSVSSDRNLKHDIEDLPYVYRELILKLIPVRFKYNDGDSGRYHLGFISQDVESAMQDLGIETKDFAGFIKSPTYAKQDENGVYDVNSEITGYIYMLRYEEFISPAISVIQEQEHRIKSLEERLENLESIIPQGRR